MKNIPYFISIIVLAFIIAIPNMSRGIMKSKGKLFPFGILQILYSAKTSKQLDLMLGGVKEKHRGLGLEVLMGIRLFDSCRKHGIETIESHLILETNTKMLAEVKRVGGKLHKRFRIYQKEL